MNQEKALLALGRINFLKSREKLLLLELFDSWEDMVRLSRRDLEYIIGRRIRNKDISFHGFLKAAEKDLCFSDKSERGFLFYWDKRFPAALREIYDPPFLLYYRGRVPEWTTPMVGIVGTRYPTGEARSMAYKLAFELSSLGAGVISGLARGVDTGAHMGSLGGCGLKAAVLGNGIDSVYPAANRGLGAKILAAGGIILSEYPPGTLPLRYNFPRRNRIISGLSRSVVVVQAPGRSGALITAEYALDQGRDIFVHKIGVDKEAPPGGPCAGSTRLVNEGAPVIESASDLYKDWGWDVDNDGIEMSVSRLCFHPGAGGFKGGLSPLRERPGRRVADMIRRELSGDYILHNGDCFRRT